MTLRALVRVAAYPVVVCGTGLLAAVGYDAGLDPALLSGALAVAGALAAAGLERWVTYEPAWLRSHGDVGTDVAHAVIGGAMVEVARIGLFALSAQAAVWLTQRGGGWASEWPLWVQLALAFLLVDLGQYTIHRVQHQTWLWRFHAIHHSAPRLYWLNTVRFHPLDLISALLAFVPWLVLLTPDPRVVMIVMSASFAHALLQHSTADLRLGPLNHVLAGPELHRWHHSPARHEQDTNYGAVLIVWDYLFGTRHLPSRRPPVDIGAGAGSELPASYVGQLVAPFRAALWAPRSGAGTAGRESGSHGQEP